jgi:hypothetical protein
MSTIPPPETGQTPPSALSAEAEELRQALRQRDPGVLAAKIGAEFPQLNGQGRFQLAFFGAPISISFPHLLACAGDGRALPLPVQALLLFHLTHSDGAPISGRWASFGELPDGRVYEKAYQGYSGDVLSRTFGSQIERFNQACQSTGGTPVPGLGDMAFQFSALPRLPLLVTYWLGEDEFPASAKVLFDRSAGNHLPIDVCAILGKMLVSRIVNASNIHND